MWTIGRLAAALGLGGTGFLAAFLHMATFEEGTAAPYFAPVVAAIGLAIGWKSVGMAADKGHGGVLSLTVRGAVGLWVCAAIAFGMEEAFMRSIRMQYDGPFEALTSVPFLAWELFLTTLTPLPVAALWGGAFLTAAVCAGIVRRYG